MSDTTTVDNSIPSNNDAQTIPAPNGATVAPVNDAGTTPASTPGPADTAVSGQPKDGDTPAPEPDKPSRDRRAEKRISTLLRKNDEAQREIGYWRGIAEAQRGAPQPQQSEGDAKPRPDQFKSYDEYVEASIAWGVRQGISQHQKELGERSRTQAAATQAGEAQAKVAEKLMEAGKDIEDFDGVMQTITAPDFPISATMRDFLGESGAPAHVAEYLADHPREARKIYDMGPVAAVRALEKIEADVAPKKAPAPANPAPPPVPTVGGRSVTGKDFSKMSTDEYADGWKQRVSASRSR